MESLLTASQTAELEQVNFSSYHISAREAMHRAGRAVADLVQSFKQEPVLIVCGTGNNGGDGYACAAELALRGVRVSVLAPCGEPRTENARYFAKMCSALFNSCSEPRIVVDALLGIGFHMPLSPAARNVITEINALKEKAQIISVDVPSGLNASDGAAETAVYADYTITFSTPKLGQCIGQGPIYSGKLTVSDIGLHLLLPPDTPFLLHESDLSALLPARSQNDHKGSFGFAGIFGGARGMEGAAMLSTLSAMKSGAGRVCLMVNEENENFYRCRPWSVMARSTHETNGLSCLAFGMGAGRSERTRKAVRELLSLGLPLVLDADALYTAESPEALSTHAPLILTPHVGEAAKLLGLSTATIRKKSIEAAQELAARTGAVIVLKNDFTVIADSSKTFVVSSPNSGLAKAGSGDVLAGCITGFLCSGASAIDAACAGVLLHSAAGRICVEKHSARAMTADQLPDAFEEVFLRWDRCRK